MEKKEEKGGAAGRMDGLQVRELTYAQAAAIYKNYLKKDFPPEEVKPLLVIRQAWSKKRYYAYGFYEERESGNGAEEVLCVYAFFLADNKNRVLLLDYFAVCEPLRGLGYGSRALALLRKEFTGWNEVIIEVEDDELPGLEEEIRKTRQRRIAFYTGAGCQMTTTRSRLWGVDYRIMVMSVQSSGTTEQGQEKQTQEEFVPAGPVQKDQESMGNKIRCLYEGMYAGKILRKHFEITAQ